MTDILGHVDGFLGAYLNGWAASPSDASPCLVEVFDETGALVGSALADKERPDLESLGLGSSAFGFRIPLFFGTGGALTVKVGDVELTGSPIAIGADRFDGYVEIVHGKAIGWVNRRQDHATTPATITITLEDGEVVGSASVYASIRSADPFFRVYHFDIPLHPLCLGRTDLTFLCLADGTRVASAGASLALDGFLDVITADHCQGWLVCPGQQHRPLVVSAYRDGAPVGSGICDLPRDGVRAKYAFDWHCGFVITFDPPDRNLASLSELSLRIEGNPRELFGGPFLVGPRFGFIAAAKQIAALVHTAEHRLPHTARALLQDIMGRYLDARRQGAEAYLWSRSLPGPGDGDDAASQPISIIIPVYRDVALTEACIQSVLDTRGPSDRVVLVADMPPEPEMLAMLARLARTPSVLLLSNATNLGFIGSVNRGLDACPGGDVLLLNADTRMFPGGLDEMRRVLRSAADIATVTAMSNNATIFTYPHPTLATEALGDIDFDALARVALEVNRGVSIDVPTGHGFCLLVRRDVLDRLGRLDESFGRGYGEENAFCGHASDLGFRHVAAAGAFVEHRGSVSFGDEKHALIETNLRRLGAMFPEYLTQIMQFEQSDPMRSARWRLDAHRLAQDRLARDASGLRLTLSVDNWLGGGTPKAVAEIEHIVRDGGSRTIRLHCTEAGLVHLEDSELGLKAVFQAGEHAALVALLDAAGVDAVVFHQLLGFDAAMIAALAAWAEAGRLRDGVGLRAFCYAHDFYAICPRATLIDAVGQYCRVGAPDVCARCVRLGGAHEASRLTELTPLAHRALFGRFMGAMSAVITPSRDTAMHLGRVWPQIQPLVLGHPTEPSAFPTQMREGADGHIVLLGAIGPHKGSGKLLELASHARLTHPHLRFTVVGYTDIDAKLEMLGNVRIVGSYRPDALGQVLGDIDSAIALFVHQWPETFSYTLSEAVQAGLLPVVPDIGAPAERVRAAGFGVVYPFPIDIPALLVLLDGLSALPRPAGQPRDFANAASAWALRSLICDRHAAAP